MQFHIAINLERMSAETDMCAVRDHTVEMIRKATKPVLMSPGQLNTIPLK